MTPTLLSRRRLLALGAALGAGALATAAAIGGAGWGLAQAKPKQGPLAAEEALRAAMQSSLCSAANPIGMGLLGRYFPEPRWAGAQLLERPESTASKAMDRPWPRDLAAPRSAFWEGWVRAPESGSYRFSSASSAPGARIAISRLPMSGEGAPKGASMLMQAGRFYPIRFEIPQLSGDERPVLKWITPRGIEEPIPKADLHLPMKTS